MSIDILCEIFLCQVSSLRPIQRCFSCHHCMKTFTRKFDLQRHMKIHTKEKEFQCSHCYRAFYQKDKKQQHKLCCDRGKRMTENDKEESSIQSTVQSGNGQSNITDETENNECDTAINGNLKTIHMKPQVHEKYDLSLFLQGKRANLEKEFKEKRGLKWFITLQVRMVKYRPDGQNKFSTPHFRSECQRLINLNELPVQYQECGQGQRIISGVSTRGKRMAVTGGGQLALSYM